MHDPRKLTRMLILAGIITAPSVALAADPAAPTLGQVLDASGVTVHGYVDAQYNYLTGSGQFVDSTGTPVGVNDRVFDFQPNSFDVNQAAITIAKQPTQGFGGLVNLTAGSDAPVMASYGENATNFDVTQAYVSYATGPLTVIGGKFVTLAGAEVIDPTANTNISRSILFGYAIPFTHTGVRATYAVNNSLSVIAGVNNGWDQLTDANRAKTAELGVLASTPGKMFSLAASGYSGNEPVAIGSADNGTRNVVDVVATFNATSKLTFVANYDNGSQKDNTAGTTYKWNGVAGYANYQLTDKWLASLRAEYFDDQDGYRTGVAQAWKEGTVTVSYLPTSSVILRAEGRYDKSNVASFGQGSGTPKDNQTSFALQAIYKF